LENVDVIIILVTVPNNESAAKISKSLVDRKLAACVNTIPGITSYFRWQDKLNIENEILLLIKTVKSNFDKVRMAVELIHPYDLPEIIALPVSDGSQAYLKWIENETSD